MTKNQFRKRRNEAAVRKVFSVVLQLVHSLTFLIGLGFLFGEDKKKDND